MIESAEIFNESDRLVGKIHGKGTIHKTKNVLETDNSVVLRIDKKFLAHDSYTIMDSSNKILGKTKRKVFSLNKKMSMIDIDKNTILVGVGPVSRGAGTISDNTGMKIADFYLEDIGGIKARFRTNQSHVGTLNIQNFSYDRKILLGFFVSMYISFYDTSSGGNDAGM